MCVCLSFTGKNTCNVIGQSFIGLAPAYLPWVVYFSMHKILHHSVLWRRTFDNLLDDSINLCSSRERQTNIIGFRF